MLLPAGSCKSHGLPFAYSKLLVKILPDYFKLNQIETLFPTNWSILNNELIYNNSNSELIKSIDFNSNKYNLWSTFRRNNLFKQRFNFLKFDDTY